MTAPPSVPLRPRWSWRLASTTVIAATAAATQTFLYGLTRTHTVGLDAFAALLDRRQQQQQQQAGGAPRRGLITYCNHISVLDDPLIWGVLPLRFAFNQATVRWSLGSHDICFKNRAMSSFFSLGQVLPTHRFRHSPHGGIFQPALTQTIRILSAPIATPSNPTFSTTGDDHFPAPAAYAAHAGAWVHVFPEGRVVQRSDGTMERFRWGIARLVLEAQPPPELVPMYIDGMQHVMPAARTWPRWLPRAGAVVRVVFGGVRDSGVEFAREREAWRRLGAEGRDDGPEAQKLRSQVAAKLQRHVEQLAEQAGAGQGMK